MTLIERFLKYVSFDTQSDDNSGVTPSTPKQMVFAQYLRSELEQLGFEEISLDENGYLCYLAGKYRQTGTNDRIYCSHGYQS